MKPSRAAVERYLSEHIADRLEIGQKLNLDQYEVKCAIYRMRVDGSPLLANLRRLPQAGGRRTKSDVTPTGPLIAAALKTRSLLEQVWTA